MERRQALRPAELGTVLCVIAGVPFGAGALMGYAIGMVEPPLNGQPAVTDTAIMAALAVAVTSAIMARWQTLGGGMQVFPVACAVAGLHCMAAGLALGLGPAVGCRKDAA